MPRPTPNTRILQASGAGVAPSTWDAEARTVDVIWSTGQAVPRIGGVRGRMKPIYHLLDLEAADMSRLVGGPVLDAHDDWSARNVAGVVLAAEIVNGEGRATLRIDDDELAERVESGALRQVSVGAEVSEWEIVEEEDRIVQRAAAWKPVEISLVPTGADAGAVVQSSGVEGPVETDPDNDPGPTPPAPAAPAPDDEPEPLAASAAQHAEIVRLCVDAGAPGLAAGMIEQGATPETARARLGDVAEIRRLHAAAARQSAAVSPELLDELIASGASPDAAGRRILEKMAAASDATPIRGGTVPDGAVQTRRHLRIDSSEIYARLNGRATQKQGA